MGNYEQKGGNNMSIKEGPKFKQVKIEGGGTKPPIVQETWQERSSRLRPGVILHEQIPPPSAASEKLIWEAD